jgi:hypothetical protein
MTEEIQRLMRIAFLNEPTCHRYIVTVDDPARRLREILWTSWFEPAVPAAERAANLKLSRAIQELAWP